MRGMEGKLITVWSPGLHGAGVSTVTDAIGFAMQNLTGKKVLILNYSGCLSYMERFLENDIRIKYTLDNLKVFNKHINTEHIYTYATAINEDLYMISGSRLKKEITREDEAFEALLLTRSLEAFDIVMADINTGVREDNIMFLEKADSILSVVTANEIMLDDLLENSKPDKLNDYISCEKSTVVFNKLYEGWNIIDEVKGLSKKYGFKEAFGLNYAGEVFEACCRRRQFYSFMMDELRNKKAVFGTQVIEICDHLIEELYLDREEEKNSKKRTFMSLFTL